MQKIIIRTRYIGKIQAYLDKPIIKVITGMRRTGKSTILMMLMDQLKKDGTPEKNILWINKESLEFEFIKTYADLYRHVKDFFSGRKGKCHIFIDEIQEISEWERAVLSLLSENIADIFITGSNARLLSSELATLLTGRYVEIPVYPLSFDEFLSFRHKSPDDPGLENEFTLFMKYGGFPGIHALDLEEGPVYQYLNSLFNAILLKDVVNRNSIREPAQLENITRFIFDNCGNITTSKRISDYLKSQKISISMDRVQNYIAYLEQAFLVYKARRYDIKGLRHLELYEKYYMGDIGLRHGFIGYREKDIGGILENIIFLELLSRGYKVSIGKFDDREIDFIAEKQDKKMYIQAAYIIPDAATAEREFSPLEKIDDNYPKLVISMDRAFIAERKGIQWKNLVNFLVRE